MAELAFVPNATPGFTIVKAVAAAVAVKKSLRLNSFIIFQFKIQVETKGKKESKNEPNSC
jgi:hypothetical protein